MRGSLVGVVVAHLVAFVGCYQPEVRDCTLRCTAPTDCTGGQVCRSDGWCAKPGLAHCPPKHGDQSDIDTGDNGNNGDNGAVLDAPSTPPDGKPTCQQACTNGTCDSGVCVIDCSLGFTCTTSDVKCPAGVPCRVVCGYHSCDRKVVCGMATACEVDCIGDGACGDDIVCNANRCDVYCIGAGSCKHRTKCANACACDVTCSGPGACAEPSECPSPTCRTGNGCTSAFAAACDQC